MGADRHMKGIVDIEWDTWFGKDVYSPLYDKIYEVTHVECDDDEFETTLLMCEEHLGGDVYDNAIHFKIFEVRLI